MFKKNLFLAITSSNKISALLVIALFTQKSLIAMESSQQKPVSECTHAELVETMESHFNALTSKKHIAISALQENTLQKTVEKIQNVVYADHKKLRLACKAFFDEIGDVILTPTENYTTFRSEILRIYLIIYNEYNDLYNYLFQTSVAVHMCTKFTEYKRSLEKEIAKAKKDILLENENYMLGCLKKTLIEQHRSLFRNLTESKGTFLQSDYCVKLTQEINSCNKSTNASWKTLEPAVTKTLKIGKAWIEHVRNRFQETRAWHSQATPQKSRGDFHYASI